MSTNILAQTSATPKILAQGQLPNASAAFGTVPAASSWSIKSAHACNTTASNRIITLDIVPSGQTSAATRRVFVNYLIAAGETMDLSWALEGVQLTAGDFLALWADAASAVTVTVTGIEAT